jgi:HEAT repeat protein
VNGSCPTEWPRDPDPDVRRATVGSLELGSDPVEAIVDVLASGLRDNAWQVHEEATATLGNLRAGLAAVAFHQQSSQGRGACAW